MPASSLSSKGQVTIPKRVRDHLQLEPGNAVEFVITPDGSVLVRKQFETARPLRGALQTFGSGSPVSTEQLDEAIARETARLHHTLREETS